MRSTQRDLGKAGRPQLVRRVIVARVYLQLVPGLDAPIRQVQAHIYIKTSRQQQLLLFVYCES